MLTAIEVNDEIRRAAHGRRWLLQQWEWRPNGHCSLVLWVEKWDPDLLTAFSLDFLERLNILTFESNHGRWHYYNPSLALLARPVRRRLNIVEAVYAIQRADAEFGTGPSHPA